MVENSRHWFQNGCIYSIYADFMLSLLYNRHHINMTSINVTGFALCVNLGIGKYIDPVDCLLFSLIKS